MARDLLKQIVRLPKRFKWVRKFKFTLSILFVPNCFMLCSVGGTKYL